MSPAGHERGDTTTAGPGRARRAIAAVAKATGIGAVFAIAAAGGVILHLNLAAPRRAVLARVNDTLAGSFQGTVVVRRLGALGLTRIGGVDAEILDPEGKRVLYAYGVRVRIGTLALLRSLVGSGPLVVRVPDLDVAGAEVVVERDPSGKLSLQRALAPRTPATGPSRGTDLSIHQIHLGHAWVHGHLPGAPILDVDLDDFAGAFASTPKLTTADVDHLLVHGRGNPGMNPDGSVQAHAALPADPAGDKRVSGRYDGRVGEVPVRAEGSLDGEVVNGIVDVPTTPPEAFAALAPGRIHLGAPASAHVEVRGRLPVLEPTIHARVGDGEITAAGQVTLPEAPRTETVAAVNVAVKDLDASLLQEGAPRSRLSAAAFASVTSRPGGLLSGSFHLENQVGRVSGQVVPAASVRGDFTERSARGEARIAERGAPTTVRFSVQPRAGGTAPSVVTVRAETTIPDLAAVARLGHLGHGRAHVVVDGRMDLDTKQIAAKASGEVSGIAVKGVRLAHGALAATAEGPVASPRVTASVQGAGMRTGGYAFTSVQLGARGSSQDLDLTARLVGGNQTPTATARAHVTNREGILVRDIDLQIDREDVKSTTRIASVRVAGGTVDVRGMTIEGLGEPIEASARIGAARTTVWAKGADVDLSRVAKLLAREEDARGHLALDVDVTARRRGAEGHVDARLDDLSVRGMEGGTVRVSTAMEGAHVRGELLAALGDAGRIELSASDVVLGRGPATSAAAWKNATGAVAIAGNADLARVFAQLPDELRPVDSMAGTIAIHGRASRPSAQASPAVEIEASTRGLAVSAKQERRINPDGSITLGPQPWHTAGLDGTFAVRLEEATGNTQVSAQLHDASGPVASIDARARLPITAIAATPGRLLTLVQDAPMDVAIDVPRRSLDAMPVAFGKLPVEGDVAFNATLRGTPRTPKLALTAEGSNLLPRGAATCVRRVDLEAKVGYDGAKADVHLAASHAGSEVLDADATVRLSAAQALAGAPLAWEASVDADLSRFPLDTVAALVGKPIAGDLSGRLALRDLHRDASLQADLDLRDLTLDRTAFPRGKVHVVLKDGALDATARLDQADGHAETRARGAVSWGAAIAPAMDLDRPIDVALRAQNFRADAAMPFVQGIFSELDGRIDTDAKIHVEPGAKDGSMSGAIVLRDGAFEVPQIGERFHGLRGSVIMKPWGTIRFDDFAAQGPSGRLTASAQAVLRGLQLDHASADVRIPEGESIPITVEGVPLGRASGRVVTQAKMTPDGKRLDLLVEVPSLHVDLPPTTGHAVQRLDPDPTVRIGLSTGDDFVAIPLGPPKAPRKPSDLAIHAVVQLGDDVEVKRGTTVDVVAEGEPIIDVGEETRVRGQIRLTRGQIELSGKQFTIERGIVSFVGDKPSDPLILATATWDAPDKTRVLADFSGHVSSGKLTLRSEPALTENQILALILFGSPDGSFGVQPPGQEQESAGVRVAGMAGGVLTQGINKAISGITSADITTRIDTSQAGNPRPELDVQLSKNVSASIGYKLGVPVPGENPDRTELTVDWRIIRNWSLSAVVGDQGSTSLDMVWRQRY